MRLINRNPPTRSVKPWQLYKGTRLGWRTSARLCSFANRACPTMVSTSNEPSPEPLQSGPR